MERKKYRWKEKRKTKERKTERKMDGNKEI